MTLVVFGADGELHRDTYYSVGGGFVVDEAQATRSEEHTSELQSRLHLVCRLLLEKKKEKKTKKPTTTTPPPRLLHIPYHQVPKQVPLFRPRKTI